MPKTIPSQSTTDSVSQSTHIITSDNLEDKDSDGGNDAVMCRRCGSMCGYIHSEDLEQEARCSGATDRRTDGAVTRTLQPPLRCIPSF